MAKHPAVYNSRYWIGEGGLVSYGPFNVDKPPKKLLARDQQRSDLLRSNRFGVHLLEPSHPQQLGKPTRIFFFKQKTAYEMRT